MIVEVIAASKQFFIAGHFFMTHIFKINITPIDFND